MHIDVNGFFVLLKELSLLSDKKKKKVPVSKVLTDIIKVLIRLGEGCVICKSLGALFTNALTKVYSVRNYLGKQSLLQLCILYNSILNFHCPSL